MSTGFLVLLGSLIFYQVTEFMSYQKSSEMLIDSAQADQFYTLNIDITLPKAPCAIVSLDVVDVTGVHIQNIEGRLHKHSLFSDGTRKGVADALKQKSNKRDQTVILNAARQQVKDKEGCQLEGEVELHKVPGNFHISMHDAQEATVTLFRENHAIDFTHTINHLSFGKKADQQIISSRYGETIPNELSGRELKQVIPFGSLYVNYFLDITEMEYTDSTYTVTERDEDTGILTDKNPTFVGF